MSFEVLEIVSTLIQYGAQKSSDQRSSRGWTFLALSERFQEASITHQVINLCFGAHE